MGLQPVMPLLGPMGGTGTDEITSLLQQLTGGPTPAQQGVQNPGEIVQPPAPPPPPQQQQSMIGRITHSLLSLPGVIADHARPQLPPGYDTLIQAGLITPEEAQKARPGFLNSIAGDAALNPKGPQGAYADQLNGILAAHQVVQQVAEQRRLDAVRANMEKIFQPKTDETLDESRDRIEKMYSYAIQHNDLATAKMLEPVAAESIKRPKAFAALHEVPGVGLVDASDPQNPRVVIPVPAGSETPHVVNAREGVFQLKPDGLYDVATGKKYVGGTVHPTTLMPNFSPVTLGGGEGQPPVVVPFNTKTGEAGKPIGEAKPTATRQESALNVAANARLQAAVSEMNNAHSNMSDYEHKLATGQANINGLSQFMSSVANTFTHDDPVSKATQSASLAMLNRQNPELARYIRRGLSFAEGESMISQRPSDFRTRMAAFLSTAASGASPDMIKDIESRRSSILTPLNDVMAAKKSSATPSPAAQPSAPTIRKGGKVPTYEEWKKALKVP